MGMKTVNSKKGITMVELMLIIVIIGIVAAMAIPRFSSAINRIKFRTSARQLLSTMRLARSQAITNKLPFGVLLDNTNRTMTLFANSNNPGVCTFETGDSVISIDTMPREFIYLGTDFGTQTLVYKPNGAASATGNIIFLSYSPQDLVHLGMIEVLASTGRTKIGYLSSY